MEEAWDRKQEAIQIFKDASFNLHKWSSKVRELEDSDSTDEAVSEATLAKQQLGTQPTENKMLGLAWNKEEDTLSVIFPESTTIGQQPITKRGILSKLAQIYDPLGLASPLTLIGKLLFRDICNAKIPWDTKLNEQFAVQCCRWIANLPTKISVPRSIVEHREPVKSLQLHGFGDASTQGVGAAVYAVVHQSTATVQRLVAAKGRLAKQGLTVPRLELVSAHMATNLLVNVKNALQNLPTPHTYAWLDSSVALYWIEGKGQYKQFVANRVAKIHQHPEISWRHVPSQDNPADLASRGGEPTPLWWQGPEWLSDETRWPPNIVIQPTPISEAEAKVSTVTVAMVNDKSGSDPFDSLLEKYSLSTSLRIVGWMTRFLQNCKERKTPSSLSTEEIIQQSTLTADEIQEVKCQWIRRIQKQDELSPHFEKYQSELNLQVNQQGLLECRGRVEGRYPVYLPTNALLTRKIVEQLHSETLHGGVPLTMAAVREVTGYQSCEQS